VKTQVRSVFRKLGAHDRADAVARAATTAAQPAAPPGPPGPPGAQPPGGPDQPTPAQLVRASCRRA
jgi:hypothetical protein